MVNFITLYASILHKIMKFAGGLEPRSVEIENAGSTTMNFWVPTNTSPSKPAVVLIHGIAADGILTWQLQVMALTEKYSVYVPNLLFFGGSHTESKERSVRFQAECVVKGLRKLGVERCIVVGISYGGMVGFQMAEHYPELVAGMVVTGTVLAMSESISKERLQKLGLSWWSECLFPTSVEGVKDYFDFISYKPPWLPNFLCKDVLECHSLGAWRDHQSYKEAAESANAEAMNQSSSELDTMKCKANKTVQV
ncbi:hypothetical protein Ancab_027428 [Ancistrocladus abbreviatus]